MCTRFGANAAHVIHLTRHVCNEKDAKKLTGADSFTRSCIIDAQSSAFFLYAARRQKILSLCGCVKLYVHN